MYRKFTLLPAVLLMFMFISGCSSDEGSRGISISGDSPSQISRQEFMMDTIIKITLYDEVYEEQLDGAVRLCRYYENMFSRTVEGSDVWKINHAGGEPVEVNSATTELLSRALEYSRIADGMFDVTIYPVTSLWDFTEDPASLPGQHELDEALTYVGWERISIDGNMVRLEPGMGIDLGGIAKGFIADRVRDYLAENGVESALINLGGNVLTLGRRADGNEFKIGVRKPFGKQSDVIGAVHGHDISVVTSGVYERYFNLDGKIYHHILNPQDGYPFENGLSSVTVVSRESVAGDALGTVCFALGEERGMALIETLDNTEAVFILDDGTTMFSSGMADMWIDGSEL